MPTVHRVLNLPTAATNGGTSNVGEPSVAISGNRILATGNWYAARSLTGGALWQYLDPDTYLIPQPPTAFCCDQTAIHDPSRNLIVYALQYRKNSNGNPCVSPSAVASPSGRRRHERSRRRHVGGLLPLPQGRTRRQPLGRHRLHDAGRQAGRERPAAHRRVQRLAGRRLASPASTCSTTSHVFRSQYRCRYAELEPFQMRILSCFYVSR